MMIKERTSESASSLEPFTFTPLMLLSFLAEGQKVKVESTSSGEEDWRKGEKGREKGVTFI